MSEEKWGYGNPESDKAFDTITLGNETWDLVWGEHPHSRSDDRMYARAPDGRIEGFSGHRICFGVEIAEKNYLKESHLSGDEIRKGGSGRILADGVVIYEFFTRDCSNALLRAHAYIEQLKEAAGGDWLTAKGREKLIGRKIYYDRTPAIIERCITDQGCIIIVPESGEFPPPVYASEPEDFHREDATSIKTEVIDPRIWWWRK